MCIFLFFLFYISIAELAEHVVHDNGYQKWWDEKMKMKEQIRHTCQKYGADVRFSPHGYSMLYDKKYKVSVCLQAKVMDIVMPYRLCTNK